ncbi:hypothetical protein EV644_10645 [Kribbella orskensis]|uniref:Uncharacterized protein n=1 Tax=Kribbella orskensis TaxID=2512216 RepID=A0ABY2BJK2_9ACTN|nr:hypothetical protein EV642_10545 [Kribbella sp. VKM Ac-2500]TCO22738.1 hypothetical protein EV644_10645 [Kribbella orskensis]
MRGHVEDRLRHRHRLHQSWCVITSPGDTVAFDNLGWVDGGAVWRFDGATGTQDRVPVGGATHLRLSAAPAADSVVVEHGFRGRFAVSVRSWSSLAEPLVRVDVSGWTSSVAGDLDAFEGHQRVFVSYLDDVATGAPGYFLAEVGDRDVRVRRLDWFDHDRYDPVWQSVMSVVALPGGEYVFGVQRSSDLVVCDPTDLSVIRDVPLAGRFGNPAPFLRAGGSELWAVDYDTVVRLDTDSLTVEDRWLGQPPQTRGVWMFLGDVWMPRHERELMIARPGAGDVVAIDAESLRVVRRWLTGREPLTVALLDGRLVARDRKTGDLLTAETAA